MIEIPAKRFSYAGGKIPQVTTDQPPSESKFMGRSPKSVVGLGCLCVENACPSVCPAPKLVQVLNFININVLLRKNCKFAIKMPNDFVWFIDSRSFRLGPYMHGLGRQFPFNQVRGSRPWVSSRSETKISEVYSL